ncbi:MAG: hypothetical protein ACM30I_10605 [Gemmatimonas sp.]
MRSIIAWAGAFVLSTALGLTLAAAQELKVGEVYRTSVKLTDNMSGVWLPLPEGEWKLIGLGQTTNVTHQRFLNGRFVLWPLDPARRPRAFITFSVALEPSPTGWAKPEFCSRKDLHHVDPKDPRESVAGGQIRCWGVWYANMWPAEKADPWLLDAYKWVGANTAGMPQTTMMAMFHRGSGVKYLWVNYMFNPEAQEFPREAWVGWDRARIVSDKKKMRFVDRVREFGERLAPSVEKGFSGAPVAAGEVQIGAAQALLTGRGYPLGLVDGERNPAVDVHDVAAVPLLNDAGRKGYADFLAGKSPRAFAIGERGAWGRANGFRGNTSIIRALNNCKGRTNTGCTVYAINDDVVWPR